MFKNGTYTYRACEFNHNDTLNAKKNNLGEYHLSAAEMFKSD